MQASYLEDSFKSSTEYLPRTSKTLLCVAFVSARGRGGADIRERDIG